MAKKKKKTFLQKFIHQINSAEETFKDKFSQFLITAFSFTAAWAWHSVIEATFTYYFPIKEAGIIPRFIYAAGITVFLVIIVVFVLVIFGYGKKPKK